MSLFTGDADKTVREKVRIKKILIILIILFPIISGFDFFNKNIKANQKKQYLSNPIYNFTPTPTMTPIPYPQLFYFKTKINDRFRFPSVRTQYILSGNNDKDFKYWYVLITAPASDDITFISFMFDIGEKAVEFEYAGNNTKNARYKFVKGLLKWKK